VGAAMIPMMLQQGYKALAVTFDVWGIANMVKDGMDQARAAAEQMAADAAAAQAENGTAKEANGSSN
jgi:4-hydroxy-2-oxoheptanedioate aldolase